MFPIESNASGCRQESNGMRFSQSPPKVISAQSMRPNHTMGSQLSMGGTTKSHNRSRNGAPTGDMGRGWL